MIATSHQCHFLDKPTEVWWKIRNFQKNQRGKVTGYSYLSHLEMNEMSTVFQKEPYSKNEAGLALASKHYIFLFNHIQLVGGFKDFFVFTRIPGKMIQLDEHIFQMGWFNHQRVLRLSSDVSPLQTGDDFQLVIVIWVLRGVIHLQLAEVLTCLNIRKPTSNWMSTVNSGLVMRGWYEWINIHILSIMRWLGME